MNSKQKLHQIHLNEWAARFSDQKSILKHYRYLHLIHATAKLTINDVSVEFDSDISEEFPCTILKAVLQHNSDG